MHVWLLAFCTEKQDICPLRDGFPNKYLSFSINKSPITFSANTGGVRSLTSTHNIFLFFLFFQGLLNNWIVY